MIAGRFSQDPTKRVLTTASWVNTVVFGSKPEAVGACLMLNRVHSRISGVRSDGVAYRANDPRLLLWVHLALVESLLVCHSTFASGEIDQDRFVSEWATVAHMIGVTQPPVSVAGMHAAIASFSTELELSELAVAACASVAAYNVPFPATFVLRCGVGAVARTLPDQYSALVPCGTNSDVAVCRSMVRALASLRHPLVNAATIRAATNGRSLSGLGSK